MRAQSSDHPARVGSGASYAGQPFHDQRYAGGPQVIPGKVQAPITMRAAKGSPITTAMR
jgi:hypothetical protein